MTTGTEYRSAAAHLLAQARQELDCGDVRQASEKGWGAAAQAVKALAEDRGWHHKSHVPLFNAVSRLAREPGNDGLESLFHVANSLHSNFYENTQNVEMVAAGLGDVARFVGLLAEAE